MWSIQQELDIRRQHSGHRRKRTGLHNDKLGGPVQAEQRDVEGPAEHQAQRQHRRPRGRDSGLLQGRKGAHLLRPAQQVRAHRLQRPDRGESAEVLHGRRAAGRGLLPPEEVPRRQVRQHPALPVHRPDLRHRQPQGLRGVQVEGLLSRRTSSTSSSARSTQRPPTTSSRGSRSRWSSSSTTPSGR